MIEDDEENAEPSPLAPQGSLDDSMRSLRLRRFESAVYTPIRGPEPFPEDEPEEEEEQEEEEDDDDEPGAEIAQAIEALGQEVRRLGATVALIPAQHAEAIASAKFEAKAEVRRELLRMADTFAASLAAADVVIRMLPWPKG